MSSKRSKELNPDLGKFLQKLMKEAQSPASDMSLTDKMRIADRMLKYEQIRLKMDDAEYGSGFYDDDDERAE